MPVIFARRWRWLKSSLALYRPEAHGLLKLRYGHDPRMAAGIYRAWCQWHLGLPDQAAAQMAETLAWARHVDHPNTTGLALCYGVCPTNHWLRRPERIEQAAREAVQLAEQMSLALWHAWGRMFLGAALFRQGDPSGIVEIEAGLTEARGIGSGRFGSLFLSIAAEAHAEAGRHREAADAMARAFEELATSTDLALAADLHRVRAAVALGADAGAWDTAAADLRQSLEIARGQEALSLELRAARDLAALLAGRGEREQAFDLLAPVYNGFSEGFGMPDLVEAKALLEALS